jgi:DNA-binding SARP family transcriptional activator
LAAVLSLALLGPPRVALETEFALPTRKAMALLAYLALTGAAPRARSAALLWSEQPDDEARRNLRQELHRLQLTPAGQWIAASADTLVLRSGVLTDVAQFRAAVEAGDFARATALHRGSLMEDFELRGAAGFMDWLAAEREAVARTWRLALAARARAAEAAGELDVAATTLRALVGEEPLQEAHHRELIRLLQRLGDRQAALAQFEHLRALLRAELALDPLPETVALARRIQSMPDTAPPAAASPQPELHPPLIGRAGAREQLRAAAGKLALIEGDAGVGKTRLAEEFAQSAGPLLRIKGREISRETPFYPVAEALLQAYLDDTAWFDRLDPVWQTEVARLLPSLSDGADRSELPAPEARGRFLEGLATALLTAAQGGSLLFDDLQWFDAASAELVAHVVRRAHRVVLLATMRGGDGNAPSPVRAALDGLARDGLLARIALSPLDEEEVLALVRALSGAAGAVVFSRRLHAATEGNPLFILESLRDLFGAGVLRREEGTWSTPFDDETEDYRELPLSPSVRDAVLRRIDRLGQGVRRLLEAASLAGDRFDADCIGACTALSENEIVDAVDLAMQSNLIVAAAADYRFSHDLVRRSLDDSLGPERRKLLHRRLAGALEECGAAPAEVARHLEAAGRAREAIRFRVRAAEGAARVYEISEALAQYQLALDDGAAGAAAFRIHAARVDHLRNRGDRAGWEAALAAMQALEAELADDTASVELAVRRAVHLFETGQYAQALAVAEQTLQRLRGRIDPLDEAKLMLEMGAALKGLGRFGEAQSRLLEALQRFSGKLPLKHANAAFWLSVLALDQGELDDAERWAQVAADGSLQAGHRRGHAMSQWTIAEIALKRGEPARAIDLMEQAVAEARAIGSLSLQRELAGALVLRLEQLGRLDDAERWRREQASL